MTVSTHQWGRRAAAVAGVAAAVVLTACSGSSGKGSVSESGLHDKVRTAAKQGTRCPLDYDLDKAASAAHVREYDADQSGRMERPLEETDVAERGVEFGRLRIALDAATVLRQHDEGKVRPGRLRADPAGERARVAAQRLLGDDGHVRAAPKLLQKAIEVATDDCRELCVVEDVARDQGVATARCEDQRALEGKRRNDTQVRPIRFSD